MLCWGIDRLSRRGAEDMLAFVRRLTQTGCGLWAMKDPWAESTSDLFARELMLGIFGTLARFESERRSQRTKAGLARRRAEGKPVRREPGSADTPTLCYLENLTPVKQPRRRSGYVARWERERASAAK